MVRLETENFPQFTGRGVVGKFITKASGEVHVGPFDQTHEQIAKADDLPTGLLRDAGAYWWEGDQTVYSGGSIGLGLPRIGDEKAAREVTQARIRVLSSETGIPARVESDSIVELRSREKERALRLESVSAEELSVARSLVNKIYTQGAGRIYDLLNPHSAGVSGLLRDYDGLSPDTSLEFAFGSPVHKDEEEQRNFAQVFSFPRVVSAEKGHYFPREEQLLFVTQFRPMTEWTPVKFVVSSYLFKIGNRKFFAHEQEVEDDVKTTRTFKGRSGESDWSEYAYLMPDRTWRSPRGGHSHAYAMQLIVPPDLANEIDGEIQKRAEAIPGRSSTGFHALFLALHEKMVGDNAALMDRPRRTQTLLVYDERENRVNRKIVS